MEKENFEVIEQKLKRLAGIKPNPNWQSGLRSALLVKASQQTKPKHSFALIMKLAGATAFIFVLLVSGTVIYAQSSLPGDILYPVKRSYENIKLAFASKEGKFSEQQKLADKRIDELKEVVLVRNEKASDSAIKEVKASVQQIKAQVTQVRKEYQNLKDAGEDTTLVKESLFSLVPVLEEKQDNLSEIEDTLPKPKQPQIQQISDTLNNLQQQIEEDLNPMPEDKSIENTIQGIDNQIKEPLDPGLSTNP